MKLKMLPQNIQERIGLWFNLAPLPLMDTQIAFTAARAINAGATLGLFNSLAKGPRTADEVAKDCSTHPRATKNLLDCLAGLDYATYDGTRYGLPKRLAKWLSSESVSNVTAKLAFQILEWKWLEQLEDFVRTGEPLEVHDLVTAPEDWAVYQDAMRCLAQGAAPEAASKIDLSGSPTRMLDVGGSHGYYSVQLCKRYPSLASTILELPGAIDRASALVAKEGMGERVRHKSGNALTDDLGEGQYDLIFISNLVHHFTAEENRALARRAARALKPGGLYVISDIVRQKDPRASGAVGATFDLYFAFTSKSGTWPIEEMAAWQKEAGLAAQKAKALLSLPGAFLQAGKKA